MKPLALNVPRTVEAFESTVTAAILLAFAFTDSETAFAYQGLAGIGYSLSERLKLDLGYKYFAVEDLDFNGVGPLGEARVYDTDYRDHSVTLGLRYAFGPDGDPGDESGGGHGPLQVGP